MQYSWLPATMMNLSTIRITGVCCGARIRFALLQQLGVRQNMLWHPCCFRREHEETRRKQTDENERGDYEDSRRRNPRERVLCTQDRSLIRRHTVRSYASLLRPNQSRGDSCASKLFLNCRSHWFVHFLDCGRKREA